MAIYRQVYMSFWTDPKVDDDFTPEDKYFYLYLMTNPYTNICGCYEISVKQMSRQTGYNEDTVRRLIDRMKSVHKVIDYDYETKEVLLINWHKYNWSKSADLMKGVDSGIPSIKSERFKSYLTDLSEGVERVYRPSNDGRQTSVTVTVTDTVSDAVTDTDTVLKYFKDDPELDSAFADYVVMRKQLKKPMTQKAISLAKGKLGELSKGNTQDAIKILNQSVMNSWQGLFPLKQEGKADHDAYVERWRNL